MQIDHAFNRRSVSLDRRPAGAVALLVMAAASVSGCAGQTSEEVAPDPVAIAELGIDPHSVTCMAMRDEAFAEPFSEPPAAEASTACPPGYELQDSDVAVDTNGVAPAPAAGELQVWSLPTAEDGASTDSAPSSKGKIPPGCPSCAQLKDAARLLCAKSGKNLCSGARCVSRCGSSDTFRNIEFSCC